MTPIARAEALFVSFLQPSAHLTEAEINAAITASLHTYGGPQGCAAAMAIEYGEHPENATRRMCWALSLVTA